jgi:hypothetical protein
MTGIYLLDINNRGLVDYAFVPLTPLFEFDEASQFTVLNFAATIEISEAGINAVRVLVQASFLLLFVCLFVLFAC